MFEIAREFSQVTLTSPLMEKDGQLFSPTLKQTGPSLRHEYARWQGKPHANSRHRNWKVAYMFCSLISPFTYQSALLTGGYQYIGDALKVNV